MNPIDRFLSNEPEEQVKTAGFWGSLGKFVEKNQGVTAAALTVAAPAVVLGVQHGLGQLKQVVDRSRGFKAMMASGGQELQDMPAARAKSLYNTLHVVAPTLAQDPNIAKSWVKRMAYQEEYVDPKTLSDLATAESRLAKGLEYPGAQVGLALGQQVGAYDFTRAPREQRAAQEHGWKGQQEVRQATEHGWKGNLEARQATEHGWKGQQESRQATEHGWKNTIVDHEHALTRMQYDQMLDKLRYGAPTEQNPKPGYFPDPGYNRTP